jgi:hypothetical protein
LRHPQAVGPTEPRLGRRTALTFLLLPPPQKKAKRVSQACKNNQAESVPERKRCSRALKPAPREKRGNPGLPQGRAFKLGTACAAIDILSDNRADTIENVEKEVARAIGMEVGALKSWRKAFNAGSKDPQARIAYDHLLQICRQQDDPPEAARRLLRKMRGH